jgi:hypothetical protein
MAKPNYSFSKRQREIAKKQKKDEKKARKTADKDNETEESQPIENSDDNIVQ